ncbi:MAG: hypothetical protein V2I67_11465 [Thermoanaerobaculales bacterium]|nr:hypothetical protein [Thermoanaerobaculales bacterium]
MIQLNDPVRCTYCDAVSDWSSEQTDTLLLGEEHECPSCGRQTAPWDEETNQDLEPGRGMHWLEADPIY